MELARLESKNRGLPDLPLALVAHPLGGIAEREVLAKVDSAMDAVTRALLKNGGPAPAESPIGR